jgi:hypothetical protein
MPNQLPGVPAATLERDPVARPGGGGNAPGLSTTPHIQTMCAAEATAWVMAGPHDVYHLPGYVAACTGFGGGEAIYLLYDSPDGAVYAPLIKRPITPFAPDRFDLNSPYGYPGPLTRPGGTIAPEALLGQALDAMQDWLNAAGLVSAVMRAHPVYTPLGPALFETGRAVAHGDLVMMNLADGYEGLWAELRTRYRSYLNRHDREGVQVSEDVDFADLDAWVDIYHQSMRRLNAVEAYYFDAAYFNALRAALGRQVRLYFARLNGQIIAGGVFFICAEQAVWHLNATHDDWMAYAPSKSVIWKVAQMLMAEGVKTINIGSGLGARRDALFQFKTGFSKRTAPFCTVRVVGDAAAYDRLSAAWRAAAGADADPGQMFPIYRAAITPVAALD